MHHSFRFYARNQHQILKLYMLLAKLIKIPIVGRWVRYAANTYGHREHRVYLLTVEEAEQIIDASANVALGPCSCRHVFHNCDNPVMSEIVVGTGIEVFSQIRADGFREITKEEAKNILLKCHQRHLIHSIARCRQDFYAICNCCSCCCVPLRLSRNYGIENALARSKDVVEEFRRQHL